MLPEGTLAGRVALVTGGGSGLGRAMALELGRLGAKVAVLGRRRHVLEETVAQLEDGVAVPADVREPNAVAEAFDKNNVVAYKMIHDPGHLLLVGFIRSAVQKGCIILRVRLTTPAFAAAECDVPGPPVQA